MAGVVDVRGPGVAAQGRKFFRACDVATLPYPVWRTDLQTTHHDDAECGRRRLRPSPRTCSFGRFRYVDELVRLAREHYPPKAITR